MTKLFGKKPAKKKPAVKKEATVTTPEPQLPAEEKGIPEEPKKKRSRQNSH